MDGVRRQDDIASTHTDRFFLLPLPSLINPPFSPMHPTALPPPAPSEGGASPTCGPPTFGTPVPRSYRQNDCFFLRYLTMCLMSTRPGSSLRGGWLRESVCV